MKEIELFLRPAPGSKPEFLAKVRPDPASNKNLAQVQSVWEEVLASVAKPASDDNVRIVLDDYTRDGWAWKPDASKKLVNITVESTDGRNKLPGFVNYLKQRQKSAYGRIGAAGVWVVSYVQTTKQQPPCGNGGSNNNYRMDCRISTNFKGLPGCTLKPLPNKQEPVAARPAAAAAQQRPPPQKQTPPAAKQRAKKGGLLGKLVGAQHRTNQHVINAAANPSQPAARKQAPAPSTGVQPLPPAAGTGSEQPTKTVQEVNTEFRQFCQDTMLDFDLAPDEVLKVPIQLKDLVQELPESERPRITMDVLKYMVYEAAEEVNEEWVAVKEPSEFVDEVVIAVYKEGAAPPEVLEELNKGELPDEVRGQQQAEQAARARLVAQQEARHKQQLEQQAHGWGEEDDDMEDEMGVAALNTKKRDRRTIEDYERGKRENAAKRGKS